MYHYLLYNYDINQNIILKLCFRIISVAMAASCGLLVVLSTVWKIWAWFNKIFAVWLDETNVRSVVISAHSDRWGCKQCCSVTQWPGEVLSLLRKKKFVSWPLSYLQLDIAPDSFFSGRGYDCSWEDFVSKSQRRSVMLWSPFDNQLTELCWLGPSQTTLTFDPWILTSRNSFWEQHLPLSPSLSFSFSLLPSHTHTNTHTQSLHSSCRLSQQHVCFSRPQRWTSGVCGNTEASRYRLCYNDFIVIPYQVNVINENHHLAARLNGLMGLSHTFNQRAI